MGSRRIIMANKNAKLSKRCIVHTAMTVCRLISGGMTDIDHTPFLPFGENKECCMLFEKRISPRMGDVLSGEFEKHC